MVCLWGLVIARIALVKNDKINNYVSKQNAWVTRYESNNKSENIARYFFQKRILTWLPGDTGALASGILLGGDDDLSSESKKAFRKSGLSHITAASGYNVVVVAGWVMGMVTKWLDKRRSIYIGIICTILYVYLAGMTIPVIRAGIMVVFAYIGLLYGRKTDIWWSLGLTVLVMMLINPAWTFEISFQLSVAATIGVVMVGVINNRLKANGWLANSVVINIQTSLGAWVMTMPLIVHHFGQLSLVAPLANALVIWVVPIIMEILGLAVTVGIFWGDLGWLVSLAAWPGLKFMLLATNWLSSWSWASIEVVRLSWVWVFGCYLTISLLVYKWLQRRY